MTTDTGSFDLARDLPLTPDRLWHVVTDAKMRERWGAPGEGMVLEVDKTDFRVGGHEVHRCGPADAPEFTVDTRWYRIDAPHDACFTETVHADGMTVATTLVTYRITGTDSGARLEVHVAVSSFVGPEGMDEFRAGWEAGLTNLQALGAELAA